MWRQGATVALVTLVRVEGSSYRKVGARLLVGSDGRYAGSISGGCLEAEVVQKAPWMVRSGAVMKRYSTLFDDTAEIPYGLGCGGTVDLLIEPAGTPEFQTLMEALAASLDGASRHVTTWLPENGNSLRRLVQPAAAEALEQDQSVFEETILPPQRLIIFGAGDDALPMVEAASLLGWTVAVVDGRPWLARTQRFLLAHQVLVARQLEDLDPLSIGDRDAVVIMTHSYEQDKAWLAGALQCKPRYLGLLGARHRSSLLISETAAAMGWSLEQVCEGLFAPVGLDLGGDGAEAIALAVISEIQGYLHGKIGASRRMSAPMVVAAVEQGNSEVRAPWKTQKIPSRCAQ